jgi:hypothetical protein
MKPDAKIPKPNADWLAPSGVAVLGVVAFSSLWMGYDLIRMLITRSMDAAQLAVFVGLVGSITTICGTALGFVGGALFGGRKQAGIGPVQGDLNLTPDQPSGDGTVVNPPSDPPKP